MKSGEENQEPRRQFGTLSNGLGHVVNVAFLNARTADTYKLRFSTQFVDSTTAGQPYTRSAGRPSAGEMTLSGDLYRLTRPRYLLAPVCRQRCRLEGIGRRTFGHRAQGTRHTTVRFVRNGPGRVARFHPEILQYPASMEPTITALLRQRR